MHEAVLIQKKKFGLVVIDVQSGKVVPRIDMELHETAWSCIDLNNDVWIIRCIKGHFSFGRNTNGRCPFLLSGIAIIHFDDMQKTHPFTYQPNKFLETRGKRYGK